jgi:hypothetical protein
VERYLVGVFFVDDLGTAGFSEVLAGAVRSSLIVFDHSVLHLSANDWATRKEATVFAQSESAQLTVRLRADEDDSPGSAFEFVLAHELGHVIGEGEGLYPSLSREDYGETTFSRLSWQASEELPNRPRSSAWLKRDFQAPFPWAFYSQARGVDLGRANQLYALADSGCFASLYALTRVEDDFAEAFALYLHHKIRGRPYGVDIGGPAPVHFRSPLFSERCQDKRRLIEQLFVSP